VIIPYLLAIGMNRNLLMVIMDYITQKMGISIVVNGRIVKLVLDIKRSMISINIRLVYEYFGEF